MQKVLAIIPARSGSKSVKDKNIRILNGMPMIAYSIKHALTSKRINRVIVSTDSEYYANIAQQYGAEVPFLRPQEISDDLSLDIEVFQHALKYFKEVEDYIPDIVVHLRPTYPIRNVQDIDNMIDMLIKDDSVDSVRCIAPAKELAYKMWRMDKNQIITPLLSDIKEAFNMPRQQLPQIYYQNACIDVIRTNVITEQKSMSGKYIKGYELTHNFDIDTEQDLIKAEQFLCFLEGKRRYAFNIDTLIRVCTAQCVTKVSSTERVINLMNKLHDVGNCIVLFTTREYAEELECYDKIAQYMRALGIKYQELVLGYPIADFYIGDNMLDTDLLYSFFELEEN